MLSLQGKWIEYDCKNVSLHYKKLFSKTLMVYFLGGRYKIVCLCITLGWSHPYFALLNCIVYLSFMNCITMLLLECPVFNCVMC